VSLEVTPWFHEIYEFDVEAAFAYRWFSKVEGACVQPSSTIHDRDFIADLGFTPFELFDVRLEGEIARVDSINWGLRSGALQTRLGLLDDIAGDPLSVTLGLDLRGVRGRFLTTVATPYASEFNLELMCSLGKEWAHREHWMARTYGTVYVGQGNRGYPWTRAIVAVDYRPVFPVHLSLFSESYVGFGGKQCVDVNHFHGWAPFQHQSVDVGASCGFHLGVYGTLTASYAYRVFAHNYPEKVNALIASYTLPFSIF
jgi:hypothetical protein